MKYLLALALIIAVASAEVRNIHSEEEQATMKQRTKECRESTHVDHDKILRMRQGHFEQDQRLMDYLSCFYKKMGWQQQDGTMDKDTLKRHMSRNQDATDAMNQCINTRGPTAPETAMQFHRCFKKALPEDLKASY